MSYYHKITLIYNLFDMAITIYGGSNKEVIGRRSNNSYPLVRLGW